MKVSFDIRFAHLPCGSWPYVSNVLWLMVADHPESQWRIYHNPWSPPQQDIINRLKKINLDPGRIEYIPIKNGCLSLGHHLEFRPIQDDSDVYHYPHFDMPLGLKGPSLVMTIHDLYPLTLPGYCSRLKRIYFRYIAAKNARRASRVITISKNTKRDIIEQLNIPAEKITVINQGYSDQFHPIDDKTFLATIAQKYHLPETFILYTGNHKPHKNIARLIQAFAQLPGALQKKYPLILTGPITNDTTHLINLAKSLTLTATTKPTTPQADLTFLGLIDADDLPALYNLASLGVLPSLYEGFGLAPLEAMVCGTPAICSNTSATPEVAGNAARMFDPYNINDIAKTLQAALQNDINNPTVQQAGFQNAKRFSWKKNANLTYQLYKEVASEGGPCPR
ncbi:MAG: glycosyltransferase family 4 protein [Phycisphaerae bacterium]|nr:glycosyltransferase family 4 protein [Phycisphaerae bacterium]